MAKDKEQPKNISEKAQGAKQKAQKLKKIIQFLKKHPLLFKIVLILTLIIVAIIIFTMIIYAIIGVSEDDSSVAFESLVADMQSLNAKEEAEEGEDKNKARKLTGGTIKEEIDSNGNGTGKYFYYLIYGKDGQEYTEAEKAEKIATVKGILAKKKIEIYDNQCLLFLAELILRDEDAIDLSLYNKEDLEAMYMFFKAEVATSSLDLRTEEERNNGTNHLEDEIVPKDGTYNKTDYDETDYSNEKVGGTIRVQKITYNGEAVSAGEGATMALTYMPLEDFDTLVNADNDEATKYFTLDEENNLIVATSNYVTVDCSITCDDEELKQQVDAQLQEKKNKELEISTNTWPKSRTRVNRYRKIPYLNYISKYTMPFSFLMSLLATTDNPDFCKDVAKLAETSYITITLHEEASHTAVTETITHKETQKIYAKLDADFKATIKDKNTTTVDVTSTAQASSILTNYHYKDGENQSEGGGFSGSNYTAWYKWEYNDTNYELTYSVNYQKNSCRGTFSYTNITSQEKTGTIKGQFLSGEGRIGGGWPGEIQGISRLNSEDYLKYSNRFKGLSQYTAIEDKEYTSKITTTRDSNSCSMEITEVNNWYEYYRKTYFEQERTKTGIGTKNLGSPNVETEEDITPTVEEGKEITNKDEIANIEYINKIKQEEKERVIKKELGLDEISDSEFNVTKVTENRYTYGTEKININSSGIKYKKGSFSEELVQVKVQEKNRGANTSISADAFAVLNKKEEEGEENEEENKNEERYETTNIRDNGFLDVYNKYPEVQDIMHSIEDWTYDMLSSRASTKDTTNLLKYLIFLYDGTDIGVTQYDLTLLKPREFKSALMKGSAISEWLKSFEYNDLRRFRNGEMTYEDFKKHGYRSASVDMGDDGKVLYHMYRLDVDNQYTVDHSWNFSYGILVWSDKNGANYTDEFLSQAGLNNLNNAEIGAAAEASKGQQYSQATWDGDSLDELMEVIIRNHRKNISEYYKNKGIELTKYELDAFIAIAYGHGNCYASSASIDLLKEYKEATEENREELKQRMMREFVTGSGFHPFTYGGWGRREELIELFFEGRYILYTGEEIDPSSFESYGSIAEAAYGVANHFLTKEVHYGGDSVPEATNNGRNVIGGDIQASWDKPLEDPNIYGVVCATFVSLAIWKADLIDAETINQYGYNAVTGVVNMLENSKYKDQWERITNFDELEEGDVVYNTGHIWIHIGDGKGIDQNYCVIKSSGADSRRNLINSNAGNVTGGFRYVGY